MANAPSPYPLIQNLRTYVSGRVDSRSGLALISAAGTDPVHSIRRLNNDIVSLAVQNSRIVGAGTNIYGQVSLAGALTILDSGYSGNPLSMVPFRPANSPEAWMYVADSNKMSKVRADGTVYHMGIASPLNPPSVTFGPDARQIIDKFSALGAWANGGTAGVITPGNRLSATALAAIFYDASVLQIPSPITGQCSLVLNGNISSIKAGAILSFTNGPEDVLVQNVYPGFSATVTSSVIISGFGGIHSRFTLYEVHLGNLSLAPTNYGYAPAMDDPSQIPSGIRTSPGNTGFGIQLFSIVQLGSVFGIITSVKTGPDGSVSATILAGPYDILFPPNLSVMVGLPTIRCFTLNQQQSGIGTVAVNQFSFQATIGTGYIQNATSFDLSHVTTVTTIPISRPVQDDDTIHISFKMDHPEYLSEGRILFDVDPTTNDFAHNYFFKAFRQSDLQSAVLSNQTVLGARQSSLNTGVIDTFGGRGYPRTDAVGVGPVTVVRLPIGIGRGGEGPLPIDFGPGGIVPVSDQSATGTSQWTELSFKVKDLTRVGNALDRTLANVAAIRIQFNVTATTQIQVSSLWIAGSYGPDIGTTGAPYFYRHRGRSSLTGAKSNPSPPILNGVEPRRQALLIIMQLDPDPQVDKLDVFRWGGSLTNWTYVGTAQNTGTPQLEDVFQDLDITTAAQLEFDNFQPFPTIDTPKSGIVNIIGNQVSWISGDQFNPLWAQGTIININGTDYHFYTQPTSATQVYTVENAGTQNGVPYFIKQATILGQPLPALWGPFSQASAMFGFGCGDLFQPGVLFLLKGNDFDSAPDILQIEVTSPSEPLMHGCIYNGLPYVWSCENLFLLYPSFQGGFILSAGGVVPSQGTNLFTPQLIPGNKGLFARWFFCVGPKIWYGAKDGIYETSGGASVSITNEWLYLLFPHDGQPGVPVTLGSSTIYPPDFTQPSKLRLSHSDGFLFFDYVDINENQTTLVYDTVTKIWGLDAYALGGGKGILTHYQEEGRGVHSLLAGGSDFNLYQMSGTTDNGLGIISKMKMPQAPDGATFQHIRDGYFGIQSTGQPSLVISIDGANDILVPLSNTSAGNYEKVYQVLQALKGKIFSWGITNEFEITPLPFSLFRNDIIIRAKQWGSSAAYEPINPFADIGKKARINQTV